VKYRQAAAVNYTLKFLGTLGVLVGFSTSPVEASVVIDTIGGWNGAAAISAFGTPSTATYGQTLIVPGTSSSLTSFAIEMNVPATETFKGYVYAWDGNKAVGPQLYSSAVISTAGSGFQAVTFNTGTLALTPGAAYVLFASISEVPTSVGAGTWGWVSPSTYSGGNFVYQNNGSDASKWTTTEWDQLVGNNAAFTATFSAGPTPVPEPTTVVAGAMLLVPLGASALRLLRTKSP